MNAPPAVKPVLCILAISLAGGALAGAACGGSASESPWPVEPDSPVLGPEGEDGKPASSPGTIADAGADALNVAAPTAEAPATAAPPNVEP